MNTRKKFYKQNWFIYLMLILFPPAGIILLWLFNKSSTKTKGILSVVSAIWLVIALLTGNSNDDTTILVENENITESIVIENSSVENNTIENNTIESIETTSTSEAPEIESIEFSMPESAEDIQVEQAPTTETKLEDVPTSESKPENHADNNSDSTVSINENILNSTASDNNDVPMSEQSVQTSIDTTDTIIASSDSNDNNNFNTYDNTDQQNTTYQYVLNTNKDRKKIHHPTCPSVRKIAPENYATSNQTIEELIAQGYTTCGNCFK